MVAITNNPVSQLTLIEHISKFLEPYSEEFNSFFNEHCKNVIDFFSNASPEQSIYEWFFDEANLSKINYKIKDFINNVEGLSPLRGLSFIRQFRLANKLEITDRWLRKLTTPLKELGLLFSKKTKGIHYKFTFNLHLPIVDFFKYLIDAIFCYYSGSTSGLSSGSTSGSKQKYFLASTLYNYAYGQLRNTESLRSKKSKRIEEIRSMHASEASSSSNITSSKIAEEKEATNPVTHSITNSTTNTIATKNTIAGELEEKRKSTYNLAIILKWVFEYAKMKLETDDKIRNVNGFANYCLNSGEKDPWIAEYINNGYVLSPVNPLKDYEVNQVSEVQEVKGVQQSETQRKAKKISPKQARRMKQQSNEHIELKGKYPYQVYLDFANYELKQKKNIGSIDGFANWLQRTGAQDDTQVAQFVDLMKQTLVGSHKQNNVAPLEQSQEEKEKLAQEAARVQEALAIDSLGIQVWESLDQSKKRQILDVAVPAYKEKYPQICTKMTSDGLRVHLTGLIKGSLGETFYKANIRDLAIVENIWEVLELRGKEVFEQMEDWEQADLIDSKIERLSQNYYELEHQQTLLNAIKSEIYYELISRKLVEVEEK